VRGKFITLEGVDGAGKSTFLPFIEARLRAKTGEVVVTREPGGTSMGERLREILLHSQMSAETEALLMFAARREHVISVIEPALARGVWVLCDRFTDATFAYQGAGRGVAESRLIELEQWLLGGLRPDHTLLFDLPVEIAQARRSASRAADRFEVEQMEFFVKVRDGYLRRAARDPGRFFIIDSSPAVERVEQQLSAIEWLR